jgi:hypothetical protein
MTPHSPIIDRTDAIASDDPWSQWIAKGVKRDRTRRKHVSIIAAVVLVGFALWVARVLSFG